MKRIQQTRRAFVCNGTLFLLGTGASVSTRSSLFADEPSLRGTVRIGLVTDMHYADKPSVGSRHYRESLEKLATAARQMHTDQPDLMVELGDLIDSANTVTVEKEHLQRIGHEFSSLPGQKHYVLGNHCVHTLTKDEFLSGIGQEQSYYSFDFGGFHFVVLDSCFRNDGQPYGRMNFDWTDANIPATELQWLRADLQRAKGKTIVFAHQRLDVSNHYSVENAAQVRKVLEDSGKVLTVLQGHSHENDYQEIAGIHYCVLAAMVEGSGSVNNAYSTMDLFDEGTIRITGFKKQQNYNWV
jgi:alkaline phosphatase